LKYKFNF